MTVALVANIARPISSAISTAFSADSYGLLSSYGLLGASASPDAVIEALFANSEVGAWYDPSDLSTLFQDSAGITPVTAAGQPVGLILDKSKGLVLGSELISNGTFDTTTTGWSADSGGVLSVVGNRLQIQNSATYGRACQQISVTANRWYEAKVSVTYGTANGTVRIGNAHCASLEYINSANFAGEKTYRFFATSTILFVALIIESPTVGATVLFDNISVKELPGNHASQATAASRPLKTSTGAADWTNYDAVDDVLNTTFPSSLGSSCTVCRANVGGAPTILTGQTIDTSYADSTDNAGLIIINRALTDQETTDVTAWLTAKGATA